MEYKVIEIMNSTEIIINYGLSDGASPGDKLRIIDRGESVIDSDTMEDLGTIDIIKATVEVAIPYEKFSICRKYRISNVDLLNPLSKFVFESKVPQELNVNSTQITNREIPEGSPISKGDLAMLLD